VLIWVLEICYNIREILTFGSSEADDPKSTDIILGRLAEPVYSRYNLVTGQTIFVILNGQPEIRDLISEVGDMLRPEEPKLHPFALHIAIMFYAISFGTGRMEDVLKRRLAIEQRLLEGSLFEITESEQFTKYTQTLHEMSRSLIRLESKVERDVANIENLLRDHERLLRLISDADRAVLPLDIRDHGRMKDGLYCLRDRCFDRARRARNLKQRVQNFIALVGFRTYLASHNAMLYNPATY
jgi:hypothetical protein